MTARNHTILDTEHVGKLLLTLSIPAFLSSLVTQTYGLVSTMFIGHYVGALGIAGISLVFPIQLTSMGIGQMFGVGGASLISRSIGAGKRETGGRALNNAIFSVFIVSLVIMIVGLCNTDFLLRLIGASADIMPYARDYLSIIFIGIFFQNLAMTMSFLVIAEGHARVSMTGMMIGAISNIIFDAIFIVGLRMGVQGAAIGTVIAQFLSCAFYVIHYLRGKSLFRLSFKSMRPKWDILRDISAVGISQCLMLVFSSLATLMTNRELNIYGGDIAVSAFGIVNRMIFLTLLPGNAMGQGLQPIIGFNYGVKRYDRVIRVIRIALLSVTVISITVFLVLFLMPKFFVGIFTTDNMLIQMGAYQVKRIFLATSLTGLCMVSINIFQSLGKPKQALLLTLRPILFLLPFILILPIFFNLSGVLVSYPIAEILTSILAVILLIPQIKELRKDQLKTGMEPDTNAVES